MGIIRSSSTSPGSLSAAKTESYSVIPLTRNPLDKWLNTHTVSVSEYKYIEDFTGKTSRLAHLARTEKNEEVQ